MAFRFKWENQFSESIIYKSKCLLTRALNKSRKPPIIADRIVVTELDLGTVAPELEMLEIGDLAKDRFRGIFKLSYSGDAYLVLQTRIQANPLVAFTSNAPKFTDSGIVAANASLTVPMFVRISDLRLNGVVILVVSKQKGVTLVFRNDPLQSVRVSSSFDSISTIESFLQREIEKQLRIVFQEELPTIIYQLSLEWGKARDKCTNNLSLSSSNPPASDIVLSEPIKLSEINPAAPLFSANILRMARLESSQRTLSPFTLAVPYALYRSSNYAALTSAYSSQSSSSSFSFRTSDSQSGLSFLTGQGSFDGNEARSTSLSSENSSSARLRGTVTNGKRKEVGQHRVFVLRNSKADRQQSAKCQQVQQGQANAIVETSTQSVADKSNGRSSQRGILPDSPEMNSAERKWQFQGSKMPTPPHSPEIHKDSVQPNRSKSMTRPLWDRQANIRRLIACDDSVLYEKRLALDYIRALHFDCINNC